MKDINNYKIFQEVDELESNYQGSSLEKIDGLRRKQFDVIKMCEYYSDSKYLDANYGNKLGRTGRPVPFYNIVNYRVALAKTATDLDIKDFQIISDNPQHQVESMLLNREAYEWMKEAEFSVTLNQMGITRPKYGGYLIKKSFDEDNKLKIDIVKWTNVITDQNDIMGGTIVECHYMSPAELQKKRKVWNNVDDVLMQFKKINSKDRPSSIEVKEVIGEFPVAIYNDAENREGTEEDEYNYSLQRYFIADIDSKKYLMYWEELSGEMEDYYEYLAWEDNGYGLGRGVIEDSEEAQVWTNDAVINESIAMALAGRVGLKTTSKKLGNNILSHDHGKIYELEEGKDINSFNLAPSALGQYQNQINKWNTQADNIASSFNAVTGEQPPSGTPYSQTALLNQVATKPFDYKREEWGIHLTKIFNKWVLPYLIKKITKEHILVSEFSETELEMIDDSFANYNSNRDLINELIEGNLVSQDQQAELIDNYKKHIKKLGKKRFIEVPDGYFDGIEAKVTVLTTGEQKNKAVILQSLSELLRTVSGSFNPATGEYGVLKDPTLSKVFNQILELSNAGISPISIGKGASPTKAPTASPTQDQTSAGPVQSPMTMSTNSPALSP